MMAPLAENVLNGRPPALNFPVQVGAASAASCDRGLPACWPRWNRSLFPVYVFVRVPLQPSTPNLLEESVNVVKSV